MEATLSQKIQNATLTLNAAFLDGYGEYTPRGDVLVRPLPVDALEALLVWNAVDTDMEEYADDDESGGIEGQVWREYSIKIRRFRKRRRIMMDHIKYGKLGVSVQVMRDFGIAAAEFPDRQRAALLNNGKTTKCWDGTSFFNATHPLSPGRSATTFSNLNTAKPLSQANYKAARSQLALMQREDESFMGLEGDLLIVDPSNADLAREIVNATIINNTTNVLQGASKVISMPQLTQGVWYIASATKRFAPLVEATLEAPGLGHTLGEGSEYEKEHDAVLYQAKAKMGFAYGQPQHIIRNDPT